MELLIERYCKNDKNNTLHSHCILRDKNIQGSWQGIEKLGKEIPEGTYNATFTHSPKFNMGLYYIDVPHRQGIRIHHGNTSKDVTGCLILGTHRINDFIYNSKKALSHFHELSKGQNLTIHVHEKNHREYSKKSIGEILRHLAQWIRKNVTN